MAKKEKKSYKYKDLDMLDKAAKKVIEIIDPTYRDREIIKGKDYTIQSVMSRQLDLIKGVSDNNIIDFIQSMDTRMNGYLYKNRAKDEQGRPLNYDNIFTESIGDIFNYFQYQYRNKYLEMTDLKLISKFIPSMGKAVKICLSSICNSDDISDSIIRNIIFPEGTSNESKSNIMNAIENFEDDLKLKKKLKNTAYKTTLVTGHYYVYHNSYTKIFEEYDRLDAAGYFRRMNMGYNVAKNIKILQSRSDRGFNLKNPSVAKEGMYNNPDSIYDNEFLSIATESIDRIKSSIGVSLKDIESIIGDTSVQYHSSEIFYEALEAASSLKMFKDNSRNINRTNQDLAKLVSPDATANMTKNEGWADPEYRNRVSSSREFELPGTYVKFMDPKNLVEIKLFEQIIGYFYIHSDPQKITKKAYSTKAAPSTLISNNSAVTDRKDDIIAGIADVISTGIMTSFSGKFVQENQQFKNLIAECLIVNGLSNNDYHIQFIPATDITKFTVNEDENGNGVSILADSLFSAKLLLDLIIGKLLIFFNKGGNRQIAHVHKGPIDTDTYNQMQRILRMLQDTSITFNDLMTSNAIFSKFARDTNMQLPTDKNGTKIVEFEQMEGQDVDMNTPMEDKLEKMAIQGTPVPASFMETIDDLRFSRQIVSDHIEFAGVISDFQSDLEKSTTELYRILLENSALSKDDKKIASRIEFKLPRPKALQNTNSAEFISTAINVAESIGNVVYGSDSSDAATNKEKMMFINRVVKDELPYLPWDKYEEYYVQAKMDVAEREKDKVTKKSINDGSMDSGIDDESFDEGLDEF